MREPYTGITITTPTYTTPIYTLYTPSTTTTHEYSTPPTTYEMPAFSRYERSTQGAEVSFITVAIAALITIIVVVAAFAIRMRR